MSQSFNMERYNTWRKHIPMLYDIFILDNLASSSLTVQWLPDQEKKSGKWLARKIGNLRLKQRLVLGTHNTEGDNHLIVAITSFSEKKLKSEIGRMQSESHEVTGTGLIKIEAKVKHLGYVNRARYMPQNPSIIATKSSSGDIHIYDMKTIFSSSKNNYPCHPTQVCKGLSAGGSGMSWNPNRKGYIISCSSNDNTIGLWDTNTKSTKNGVLNFLNVFNRSHPSGVNDCSWHSLHASLFGSVGDDKKVNIWDIRADLRRMPSLTGKVHKASVNCLSFSYFSDHLLATGSSDQTIAFWDLRKMKSPCHLVDWHKDGTYQIHWSPNNESILASSGVDNRLLVWDISKIGAYQTSEEANEAPPELLFIHGGHTDTISDFSWNISQPWVLSSVSNDKIIQVWQMGEHIYDSDSPTLKSEESEESKECQTKPESSKSSYSKLLSQTDVGSSSLKTSFSESLKSTNLIGVQKSADTSVSPQSISLPLCPSPKTQKQIIESLEYLAIPGPSKILDSTPKPSDSTKSQNLGENIELPNPSGNADYQEQPETQGSQSNISHSATLCHLAYCELCLPIPNKSPACEPLISDDGTNQCSSTPELPSSLECPNCQGFEFSQDCQICLYLKKHPVNDYSLLADCQSQTISRPLSLEDFFSDDFLTAVNYPSYPNTQLPLDDLILAYIEKFSGGPSATEDTRRIYDGPKSPDIEKPAGSSQSANTLNRPGDPSTLDIKTQDASVLLQDHKSTNCQEPQVDHAPLDIQGLDASNRHPIFPDIQFPQGSAATRDVQAAPDSTITLDTQTQLVHSEDLSPPVGTALSYFQTPPHNLATPDVKTNQDTLNSPQDHPAY